MFKPSSIRMAMLRSNIIHAPFSAVKTASSDLKLSVSRKSFMSLLDEIKAIDSKDLPKEIVDEIGEAFDIALDPTNKTDLPFFYSKFASCPGWVKFYSLLHREKLHNAFELYQSNPVMNAVIDRYEDLLLSRKDTAGFLRLYKKAYKVKPVKRETLINFIKICIETKDDISLGKFFENYILYTGPEELVKTEALQIDERLMETIIDFFADIRQVKPYSKCVGYYIKKLKENPSNIHKIEKISTKSKLIKFGIYVEKLGPLCVIENGMFHKFRILEISKIGSKQLKQFTELLSIELQSQEITVDRMFLMIDQMNGLGVRPSKYAFTTALNPDIQMGRILKFIIDKTEDKPDTDIVNRYYSIMEKYNNKAYTHMKDHLPKKFTRNQVASRIPSNFKYKTWSFEIIIQVLSKLSNVATVEKDGNTRLSNVADISARIFTIMIKEHNMKPSKSCFQDLYQIFSSSNELKAQIPMIKAIEGHFYPVVLHDKY